MSSSDSVATNASHDDGKHTEHLGGSPEQSDERSKAPSGETKEREVTDPITHLPLVIHDANHLELEQIPWLANIPSSALPASTAPSRQSSVDSETKATKAQSDSQSTHQDFEHTADASTANTWIPDPEGDARRTRLQTSLVAGGAAAVGLLMGSTGWGSISYLLGGRGKWFGWLVLPLACILFGLAVGGVGMVFGAGWKVPPPPSNDEKRKSVQTQEIQPGTEDHPLESPEWLNALLKSLWPIINPSLFASLSDMLEDSMQATLPSLVNGVRVADLGQGSEPVRILSIKMLDKGHAGKDVNGMKAEEGDFVNMEVGLGYRTQKTTKEESGMKKRTKNIHLLIEFYTTGGLTIPVFVNLTSLLALIRCRVQLTPNPPFLSILTLSLMGQPHVSLSCTPLSKNLFNVMDIPGLSSWLRNSIDLAVSEYVAPRSISLDLKELLGGIEPQDVLSIGVVFIRIIRATGIGDGDGISAKRLVDGKKGKRGDAYVSVAWKQWGKAMWSTRVISGAQESVWEETCVLLVGKEEVDAGESIRVQIWDADNYTADDLIGNVDVPLKDLLDNANPSSLSSISTRSDELKDDKGHSRPGTLDWEVAFFGKTTLEQHFEADGKTKQDAKKWRENVENEAAAKLTEGMPEGDDPHEWDGLREKGEKVVGGLSDVVGGWMNGHGNSDTRSPKKVTPFERTASTSDQSPASNTRSGPKSEIEQQKLEDVKEKTDALISTSAPDSDSWPSGILSITIESISGLEIENVRKTGVNPEGDAEVQEGDAGVEGGGSGGGKGGEGELPSAFCVVILNHEKVYKTRVKMKSSNPFFNAQTEKFIPDLKTASVFISVRDSRMHENNPIIGVVSLPLSHIFSSRETSMFCDSLPLVGGIGFGRMRVRLLWRSVQLKMPKEMAGWGVGTLEVGKRGVKITQLFGGEDQEMRMKIKKEWEGCRLVFRTSNGVGKMLPSSSRLKHAGANAGDEGEDMDWVEKRGRAIHLAVTKRYKSCLTLEVRKRVVGPDRTMAFGVGWLKDLRDDEDGMVGVDLWRASSSDRPGEEQNQDDSESGGILSSLNPTKLIDSKLGRTSDLMSFACSNACSTSDMERQGAEKVCTLEIPIKFWSGLSGYHRKMAGKESSGNLKDVMEVLDYVQGEEEGWGGSEGDSSSSSSSDSEPDYDEETRTNGPRARTHSPEPKSSNHNPIKAISETKNSVISSAKSVQKHQHDLSRKHRGLMQWKAARNVAWLGREVERKTGKAVGKVKERVGISGTGEVRDPKVGGGIEREV